MAEIQQSESKRRGVRSKKLSTRVDLTPMVDLGFLLITFFIFTTALSKPAAMHLVLPADGPPTTSGASKTLSLILDANNQIAYYKGTNLSAVKTTDFSANGIRTVLQKQKDLLPNRNDLVVLIKPSDFSSYENIVAVLDEMQINQIRKYLIMDLTEAEKNRIVLNHN
jgi:biopolymer transport protein ExbD